MKPREIPSMNARGAPGISTPVAPAPSSSVSESRTTGAIRVDKNIPLPSGRGIQSAYPFGEMAVGDSFFIRCAVNEAKRRAASISQCSRNWRTANDKTAFRLTVRHVEGGVRCWRLK